MNTSTAGSGEGTHASTRMPSFGSPANGFQSVRNSLSDSVATWARERTLRTGLAAQLIMGIWPGELERYRSAEVNNAQALVAAVSAAEP